MALAAVMLVITGSRSEALSQPSAPLHAPGPAAPVLIGLELGQAHAVQPCGPAPIGQQACLQPGGPAAGADAGLQTLQLAQTGVARGLHRAAVALQLGQGLESVSLQFDGAIALETLPLLLQQRCGAPEVDSRMDLDGGAYLRSISWQCPDAGVQLNALWRDGQAQGALNLTTARGQAWFDGGDAAGITALAMH